MACKQVAFSRGRKYGVPRLRILSANPGFCSALISFLARKSSSDRDTFWLDIVTPIVHFR